MHCIGIGPVGTPDGDEQLGRESREGLAVTMNPFQTLEDDCNSFCHEFCDKRHTKNIRALREAEI